MRSHNKRLVVSGTSFFLISPFHLPAVLFYPKLHLKHDFNSNRLSFSVPHYSSHLCRLICIQLEWKSRSSLSEICLKSALAPQCLMKAFLFRHHANTSIRNALWTEPYIKSWNVFILLRSETYVKLRENQGPLVNSIRYM